jgi:hypothetical protein
MNEQIQTEPDQIAKAPPADIPTTVATGWRSMAQVGDSFCYFASPASLMRTRSRSVSAEEIGAAVWSMYAGTGRCVPVQRRNGLTTEYLAIATDNGPVRALAVPQPMKPSKKLAGRPITSGGLDSFQRRA